MFLVTECDQTKCCVHHIFVELLAVCLESAYLRQFSFIDVGDRIGHIDA